MKNIVIKDLDLTLNLDNKIQTIIGSDDLCKRTLLYKLNNKIDNKDIFIDNTNIKEYDIEFLRNNFMVVFNDENYNTVFVSQELYYNLSILNYSNIEIDERIQDIVKRFKIKDILDSKIESLKVNKRILIHILSYLIVRSRLIVIDNLFSYINDDYIKEIIKYCKKYNICLINVTTNVENLLFSDYISVLDQDKCIIHGSKEEILQDNSILPYLGINLPFITELSQNLILYGLIDKNYYDIRKLVDKLWN